MTRSLAWVVGWFLLMGMAAAQKQAPWTLEDRERPLRLEQALKAWREDVRAFGF